MTEEQSRKGQAFVDYLATDEVQAKAMTAGYRPSSATLTNKVTEIFAARSAMGVTAAPRTGDPADTRTKEGLIFNWNEWFKRRGGA